MRLRTILASILAAVLAMLGLTLVVAPSASAGSLSFAPTGDTFVTSVSANAGTNYGTSPTMRANGSPQKITMLQFDVSGIPEGATDVAPKLVLHASGCCVNQPAQTVRLQHIDSAWDASMVSYNTRPTLGGPTSTAQTLTAGGTVEFPLNFAANGPRDWAVTASGTQDAVFASSEDPNPELRPQLVITYTDPVPPPPPYGSDGRGNPKTDDCTATVAAGGDVNAAIAAAAAGAVVCVAPADYSGTTVTLNKAVTLRANGVVKIKNATVNSGATLDGFTIVGGPYGTPASGVNFSGNNNRIVNNLINGHGLVRGIYCTSCGSGTVIGHNTITKISNYGIQTSNGTGIVIEWNNIYDLYDDVDGTLDTDAMRPFGTNHIVRNNYMHDLNAQRSILGPDNDRPHLDCIQHYQTGSGTAVDGLLVENNICVRVTGMFIITKNNLRATPDIKNMIIRGNVAETYGTQVVILSGVPNVTVEDNSFFGGSSTGPVLTVEHSEESGAQAADIRVQNNVLVRGKRDNLAIGNRSSTGPPPAGVVTVNRSNVDWVDTSIADRDVAWAQPNPAPMDRGIVVEDFTLYRDWSQEGGPLIDQGSPLLTSGFTTDVEGDARVQGAAVDIGAYELG